MTVNEDDDDAVPDQMSSAGFHKLIGEPVIWCNGNRHIRKGQDGCDLVSLCDCPLDLVLRRE